MATDAKRPQDLFLENRSALIDYAARILGSRDQAEDIVQDAFLRLKPEHNEAYAPRQVVAYLYSIVRNLAFDQLKRRNLEGREQSQDPPFWMLPQQQTSPEQSVLLTDQIRVASETLRSLPDAMRRAIELYRLEGWTLEAIAGELNLSTATVHRHIRTGLTQIALAIEKLQH